MILSARDEDYVLYQAMHSNVPGYVHKNDKPEVLRQAIRLSSMAGTFYSPSVLQMCPERQADPAFFNKLLTPAGHQGRVCWKRPLLWVIRGGLPDGDSLPALLSGSLPYPIFYSGRQGAHRRQKSYKPI